MKKIIIPIIILLAIGAIGWFVIPKEQSVDDEVVFDSTPQYPWEEYVGVEDISKRTAYTRDYAHPTDPNKRVMVQTLSNEPLNPEEVVFGDTDTSSTNNKDVYISEANPNGNYYDAGAIFLKGDYGEAVRTLIHFTLPSGSGTISDVKLYLYIQSKGNYADQLVGEIHELSRTNWVETEVTWNEYSSGNSWTSAGGDYVATIIDSNSDLNVEDVWRSWVLMGTGASNPLTLDWEDDVHLLLKDDGEDDSSGSFVSIDDEDYGSNKPYLEITYEPTAARRIIITQ